MRELHAAVLTLARRGEPALSSPPGGLAVVPLPDTSRGPDHVGGGVWFTLGLGVGPAEAEGPGAAYVLEGGFLTRRADRRVLDIDWWQRGAGRGAVGQHLLRVPRGAGRAAAGVLALPAGRQRRRPRRRRRRRRRGEGRDARGARGGGVCVGLSTRALPLGALAGSDPGA